MPPPLGHATQVVKMLGKPESTIRDACGKHNVDIYREDRAAVLVAFKAASPDVKSKASVVVTMRIHGVIKLATRFGDVEDDVMQVGGW